VLGGALAHICCIILALLVGKAIKKCLHDSILAIIGGLLFLVFGTIELVNQLILGGYAEETEIF
jgi:putative Ca2+/H+ antiporter (TMEM165/GDT1 family)